MVEPYLGYALDSMRNNGRSLCGAVAGGMGIATAAQSYGALSASLVGGGTLASGGAVALGGLVMVAAASSCNAMMDSGSGGGSDRGGSGGEFRDKARGAQAREQKTLDEIARKLKIDRRSFGDWVEEEKAVLGRGSSSEFSYQKLVELARLYIKEGGK